MTTTTAPATWQRTAPGVLTSPTGWKVVNTQSVGYPWIVVRADGTPVGPGPGYGYMSAERAQQVADDEIRRIASIPTIPTVGTIARFDLGDGDSYIGEIHSVAGGHVTLRNYSAWYDGTTAPYSSPYFDDAVRIRVDRETTIEAF